NFAPRFGAAYRLSDNSRTVLRGGAGVYYDTNFAVATDGANGAPFNAWQFQNLPNGTAGAGTGNPPIQLTYGFAPDLRIPLVLESSAGIEHAWTHRDVFSVSYAGSSSNQLLRREVGPGSSSFLRVSIATNHGESNYHALQAQYRRNL